MSLQLGSLRCRVIDTSIKFHTEYSLGCTMHCSGVDGNSSYIHFMHSDCSILLIQCTIHHPLQKSTLSTLIAGGELCPLFSCKFFLQVPKQVRDFFLHATVGGVEVQYDELRERGHQMQEEILNALFPLQQILNVIYSIEAHKTQHPLTACAVTRTSRAAGECASAVCCPSMVVTDAQTHLAP